MQPFRPLLSIRNRVHNLDERLNDWHLGIFTSEWHQQIDPSRPDFRGYGPTTYRDWRAIRRHIVATPRSSFVDYGAGLGRVTALAARLPFKRVIGVEIDRNLTDRGNANLQNARGLVTLAYIVCADATTFEVPADATTLFFCNPFTGSVLSAVLSRARESLTAWPRAVQFICNVPEVSTFETEIRAVSWLSLEKCLLLSDRRKCLIFDAR